MKRVLRIFLFAVAGGAVALLVGLVWVALAPENGFGDLAAASVTIVFLIPLGLILGALLGWSSTREPVSSPQPPEENPSSE